MKLQLGNKTFHHHFIQGPLAGVSCAPFRTLTWRYSQPAFSCTEMMSCKTVIQQPKKVYRRFVHKDPAEGPVCFQLASSYPTELATATRIVTAEGADLIDLNCGCPVNKIRSKGAGSRLLHDPIKLYQLISAMKQNTHVPVSIKIRVESCSGDKFNADVLKAVSDAGADFLIVHGRHWTEGYDKPCSYDDIRFFVNGLKIPVIGNGDIACATSYQKMLATGCAGVMISRAGMGQPWLIRKIIADYQQEKFVMPSSTEIAAIFIEHIERLTDLLQNEKFAILQARKFAKYYARNLENRTAFCHDINNCVNLKELQHICSVHF